MAVNERRVNGARPLSPGKLEGDSEVCPPAARPRRITVIHDTSYRCNFLHFSFYRGLARARPWHDRILERRRRFLVVAFRRIDDTARARARARARRV